MKRQYRITRANDYKRVRQNGKGYSHPLVMILVLQVPIDEKRIGIIVGKSIGNAVKRNLVKRRIKSIANEFIYKINKNVDILVIAKSPIASVEFMEIHQAIEDGLRRARLIVE